jgi:hypothetical protein
MTRIQQGIKLLNLVHDAGVLPLRFTSVTGVVAVPDSTTVHAHDQHFRFR